MLLISVVLVGKINLGEYQTCMLASLRSCLPKVWSPAHEVAWRWFWENVEKLVSKTFGSPPKWETALAKFDEGLAEEDAYTIRKRIYETFFALYPPGQYLFKQSDTYLQAIASRNFCFPL